MMIQETGNQVLDGMLSAENGCRSTLAGLVFQMSEYKMTLWTCGWKLSMWVLGLMGRTGLNQYSVSWVSIFISYVGLLTLL